MLTAQKIFQCGGIKTRVTAADCVRGVARDVRVPAYDLTSASFSWAKMFGHPVTLTAYVDNIFDKKYIQDVILSTPSFGVYTGNYAPPRTYGVRLRYDF